MESTLANIRQLFNAKAITVTGKTIDQIADNEIGFVNKSTGKTVKGVSISTIPDEFLIVAKVDGKTYYGIEPVKKANMINIRETVAQNQVVNIWSGMIKDCNCLSSVLLNIRITSPEFMNTHGNTAFDGHVVLSSYEMRCHCSCDGKHPVYENNVITKLLVDKVNTSNTDYYSASLAIDTSDVPNASTAPSSPSPNKGDLYYKTAATKGIYIYDGTAWKIITDEDGNITDEDTFQANIVDRNLGDTVADYGPYVSIIITGNVSPSQASPDVERDYVSPLGYKLLPSIILNGDKGVAFTEIQDLQFSLGEGRDLRHNEWENMTFYTNLNYDPVIDTTGMPYNQLIYQFSAAKNYTTFAFEYLAPNVNTNDGRQRLFGVTIGVAADLTTVISDLKAMFGL